MGTKTHCLDYVPHSHKGLSKKQDFYYITHPQTDLSHQHFLDHRGKIVLSLATASHFTRHLTFLNQLTCLLSRAIVLHSQTSIHMGDHLHPDNNKICNLLLGTCPNNTATAETIFYSDMYFNDFTWQSPFSPKTATIKII
jgi:hypothetical protein